MKLTDIKKLVNGKITAAQRDAGVLLKQLKLQLPVGFWVCLVKLEDIQTDHHQRERDPSHLRNLIKNYCPLFVNMPVVTCRMDGRHSGMTLYAEDGWHTIGMMLQQQEGEVVTLDDGTKVIQCLVNFDLDRKQAARLFSVHNSSGKSPAKWKIFEAGYIGGDSRHESIINAANKYNLSTPISGCSPDLTPAKAQLQSCNLFLRVVENKKQGVKFLEKLFSIHQKTWCKEKLPKDYKVSDGFLKALIEVMENNPSINSASWVRIINNSGRYQGIKELGKEVQEELGAVRCDKMCFRIAIEKRIASYKRSVSRKRRKAA